MKQIKFALTVAALAVLNLQSICAKIIIVDNDETHSADFRGVQEAHDAAEAGDTIYVMPSVTPYGDLVVTKRLQLYGPGYFLAENAGLQHNQSTAMLGNLQINRGASGAVITGLEGIGHVHLSEVSDVVLERFKVHGAISLNSTTNSLVVRCYAAGLDVNGNSSNALIMNNIFRATGLLVNGKNSLFTHNSYEHLGGAVHFADAVVLHNIFGLAGDTVGNTRSTFNKNIFIGDVGPFDPDRNTAVSSWGDVVLWDKSTSPDGKFQLTANSPARGAGFEGVDIGPFGGTTPYILSGIPNLPNITEFHSQGVVSSSGGLAIEFKAQTNP